ncbi:DUF4861 domain-containing protein [Pontibacter silvestris]|uniref:DUF4861 domain-containing protein n=1 Tax=Pontibacter silvestris TaxID=2305183 RepID=A0ABW4X1Q8_9BACT|nr:DUF4861 domain-containing protein [Pontibacter silvestris]MCC9135115.1 DUF4861 domain-containing protein [Pontibacter silvestris]
MVPDKLTKSKWAFLLLGAVLLSSCQQQNDNAISFTVKNNLDLDRNSETISIPVEKVAGLVQQFEVENLLLRDAETDSLLVTQALDIDADGTVDEILFQADIKAKTEKSFVVSGAEDGAVQQPKSELTTYSRLVPERVDDYAWENDRIGFRVYGPEGQRRVEAGEPGGAFGSGPDIWLKRVSYSVLDKWYEKDISKSGSYHEDTGEGYDPYLVGSSRGLGGIGVWEVDSLYVSKNFVSSKKIAEGPIRTVFELTYAPWDANGRTINEKKRISLDLGSNMTRVEEVLETDKPLPNLTIGITLHDKRGEVKGNQEQGWFRYWEPMDDSYLGTGIVVEPEVVQEFRDHRVEAKDESHLYVITKPGNNRLVYYAGFGWDKSGQFKSLAEWDAYLASFAKRVASPLEVTF